MIREFGLLTKINATEEQWTRIDAFLDKLQKADVNKEVEFVLLPFMDMTKDRTLADNFIYYVITSDIASFELREAVGYTKEQMVAWTEIDQMIPYGAIIWKREDAV